VARLRDRVDAPAEPDRRGQPLDPPPRFRAEFERVRVDPEMPLWFDEHGNTFFDERRLKPTGMTLVKLSSRKVEADA
jgi:hypothetical protein